MSDPGAKPHSLRSNALAIFAGQVATWIITTVTFGLVSRQLGADDFGVWSIGGTFAGLATVLAGLGMSTLIARDVARDPARSARLIGTALWVNLAFGIVAGAGSVLAGMAAGYPSATVVAIVLSSVAIPFGLVSGVVIAAIQGREIMRHGAIMDVFWKFSWLVCVLVFAIRGSSLNLLLIASLVQTIIIFVFQMFYLRRFLGLAGVPRCSFGEARRLVRDSIPFFLTSVFFTIYTSIDVVLLSKMAESRDVGLYTVPMRLFGTMLFIPVTIMTVSFPRMAAASHDTAMLARVAGRALRLSVATSVPVALAAVGLSDHRFVGILGESFRGSGAVLIVLAISVVPTGVSIVASRIVFATDRQSAMTVIGLGAVVAKIALGLALIPLFHRWFGNPALGAAVGLVAIELGMTVVMMRFLPAQLLDRAQLVFYVKLGLATAAACGVAALLYPATAIGASTAACIVYAILALTLRAFPSGELGDLVRTALGKGRAAEGTATA